MYINIADASRFRHAVLDQSGSESLDIPIFL